MIPILTPDEMASVDAAAPDKSFGIGNAIGDFLIVGGGGLAVGLVLGWFVASVVLARVDDALIVATTACERADKATDKAELALEGTVRALENQLTNARELAKVRQAGLAMRSQQRRQQLQQLAQQAPQAVVPSPAPSGGEEGSADAGAGADLASSAAHR